MGPRRDWIDRGSTRPRLTVLLLLLGLAGAGGAAPEAPAGEPSPEIAGARPGPGEREVVQLDAGESFAGSSVGIRVVVVRGVHPGPVLCLTAAVHGDELNGVEVVRRTLASISPGELAGTLVAVPIVNVHGFQRNSRYLPDRRDLNRYFPGNPTGSSASRLAFALFDRVIRSCDALVDLHTGSFHRTNLPQVRADLSNPAVRHLAEGFGGTIVLHSEGPPGTLRRAATEQGIPAITYEAGEPMRLQEDEIARGVSGIRLLLGHLGMLQVAEAPPEPPEFYHASRWVRADHGGILLTDVALGERVEVGQRLGTITDPIVDEQHVLRSPHAGRVLGMAVQQVVIPGYAAFHIGLDGSAPEAEERPELLLQEEPAEAAAPGHASEADERPE